MKKIILFVLCLAVAMTLCSCGANSDKSDNKSDDNRTKITAPSIAGESDSTPNGNGAGMGNAAEEETNKISWPNDELARQCLSAAVQAQTEEELLPYLTADSAERAQAVLNHYPDSVPTIRLTYETHFENYDIFSYTLTYTDNDYTETLMMLMERGENGYRLCINPDAQNAFANEYRCTRCQGNGTITTGNRTACAICGGTGQQYIPNQYFDPITNMPMGGYIGCGGCGGSGYIGQQNTEQCPVCEGFGLDV